MRNKILFSEQILLKCFWSLLMFIYSTTRTNKKFCSAAFNSPQNSIPQVLNHFKFCQFLHIFPFNILSWNEIFSSKQHFTPQLNSTNKINTLKWVLNHHIKFRSSHFTRYVTYCIRVTDAPNYVLPIKTGIQKIFSRNLMPLVFQWTWMLKVNTSSRNIIFLRFP